MHVRLNWNIAQAVLQRHLNDCSKLFHSVKPRETMVCICMRGKFAPDAGLQTFHRPSATMLEITKL